MVGDRRWFKKRTGDPVRLHQTARYLFVSYPIADHNSNVLVGFDVVTRAKPERGAISLRFTRGLGYRCIHLSTLLNKTLLNAEVPRQYEPQRFCFR